MEKTKNEPEIKPIPATPLNLSPQSRELWEKVVPIKVSTPGRLAILQGGLEAKDETDRLSEKLKDMPLVNGCHLNPLLKACQNARKQFFRAMISLGLNMDHLGNSYDDDLEVWQ